MSTPTVPYISTSEAVVGEGHPTLPDVANRVIKFILQKSGINVAALGFIGFMPAFNVVAFGAAADGLTDDTAAIQATYDAAVANGLGRVVFPHGTYKVSAAPVLTDASNIHVSAHGAKIVLTNAATHGLRLAGVSTNITVEGLHVVGPDTTPSVADGGAAGIGTDRSSAGGTATGSNIRVIGCRVEKTARGIIFDGTAITSWSNVRIQDNYIYKIRGVQSGTGYGILAASGTGYKIVQNTLDSCERHSTYVSIARDVLIHGNRYLNHRLGVANGAQSGACEVARAGSVVVQSNTFDTCDDGAISIEPHESDTTFDSSAISVVDNIIRNSPRIDIYIGGPSSPSTTSLLEDIVVARNVIQRPAGATNASAPIYVLHGNGISILDNRIRANNAFSVAFSAIYLSASGGATYTNNVLIRGNQLRGTSNGSGPLRVVEVGVALCTASSIIEILDNRVYVPSGPNSVVAFDATRTTNTITVRNSGAYVVNDPAPATIAGEVALCASNTTFASAGTNGAVPAAVDGYLNVSYNGGIIKIPYFH